MHSSESNMDSIVIFGANYGLLIAAKFVSQGIRVVVYCTKEERQQYSKMGFLINYEDATTGTFQKTRVLGNDIHWVSEPEELTRVSSFIRLGFLCVSESALVSLELCRAIKIISQKGTPFISMMNIPYPEFFAFDPRINVPGLFPCYSAPTFWRSAFRPGCLSYASPEPQFTITDSKRGIFLLRLGGTFRIHQFSESKSNHLATEFFTQVSKSIDRDELPIKFKFYTSVFPALSKLPMLMAGNYRCLQSSGEIFSISEAIRFNRSESEGIYHEVANLLTVLGAKRSSVVPFFMYFRASSRLNAPSSVARALKGGATTIERVDKLVLILLNQLGLPSSYCSRVVSLVESVLTHNALIKTNG